MFFTTACSGSPEGARSATPANIEAALAAVTPEALVTELEPTKTLTASANQLADLLGIDSDNILVRIQSRDCSVCKIDASAVEYPDLPLADAQSRLETNDKLWLVVQDLTCYYYYDGKSLSPLACGQDESAE